MQEKIQEEIKNAMRAKDQVKLVTLRGVLAAFTNESVALGRTPQDRLSEQEQQKVIQRLVKQRKDSIEQFEKGGRQDLADNERAELKVLGEYLPEQMSEDEVRKIVMRKKEEMGISDKSKMGQLMGAVMKEAGGKADGTLVKKIVEEILV